MQGPAVFENKTKETKNKHLQKNLTELLYFIYFLKDSVGYLERRVQQVSKDNLED